MLDRLVNILLFVTPLLVFPFVVKTFELPKLVFFQVMSLLMLFVVTKDVIEAKGVSVYGIFKNKQVKILLGLILLCLATATVFSIAPKLSFWGSYWRMQGVQTMIFYLLFFFILCFGFHKKHQWEKAYFYLFMSGGLVMIYAFFQASGLDFVNINLQEVSLGRVFTTFGHPNYYASFLLLGFFPLLAYLTWKKEKNILLACVFLVAVMMVFTKSRAGMLGMSVGAIFYLILNSLYLEKRKMLWGVLIVVLCVVGGFVFSERAVLEGENLRSIETRLSVWESSMPLIAERPFFGHGMGTFSIAFAKFADPELLSLERIDSIPDKAHNTFLELGVQTGLFGVLVYLFGLFVIAKIALKDLKKRNERTRLEIIGILSAFVSIFVVNLWGFSVTTHYILTVFLLAHLMFLTSDKSEFKKLNRLKSKAWRRVVMVFTGIFVVTYALLESFLMVGADYQAAEAFEAVQNKDANEAVHSIQLANLLNPNQSYYNFLAAEIFYSLEEREMAEYYLDNAGHFSSFHDPFYYLMKGKIQKDVEAFEKGRELAPADPRILFNWGLIYFEEENCELALEKFEEYLDLMPTFWQKEGTDEYRLFYKHNPNFDEVFRLIDECESKP